MAVFVRKDRSKIRLVKSRNHFAGQNDGGMKQTNRDRIVDGCRFKKENTMRRLDR